MLENQDGDMIWKRKQYAIQHSGCKVLCLTGIIRSANVKEKHVSRVVFLGKRTVGVDRITNKVVSDHANNADLIAGYRLRRLLAGCLR